MKDHCAYDRGVAALLAGDPDGAVRWFAALVAADPSAVVGHAGLAVALAELGDDDGASAALARARRRGSPRQDRHHVAVVELLLSGAQARGSCLATEHLDEFPDDAVVRHLLARHA